MVKKMVNRIVDRAISKNSIKLDLRELGLSGLNLRVVVEKFLAIVCLVMVILSLTAQGILAHDKQEHVFSTWEGFEADKCASIWLIHHFIDPNAVIKFFPKGEPINEGVPFDVPDAKFRRYATMSTFESLLQHYNNLNNRKLIYIGKVIHDIEINTWEEKVMPETTSVQDSINKIILQTRDEKQIIEKGNKFFNNLYRGLTANKCNRK